MVGSGGGTFVGRTDEQAVLSAAFRRAAGGTTAVVLVCGEAGIGKTRLVEEFRRTVEVGAGQVPVLYGAGAAVEPRLPYLPFVEMVTAALAVDPGLARYAGLRALADGDPGDPGALVPGNDRVPVFRAVLAALRSLAGTGPLLLVLEDLHWADGASIDLLLFLLSRLRTDPVTVVVTARTEHLGRNSALRAFLAEACRLRHVDRIDLGPLDADVTLRLVRALAPGDEPPAGHERVARRSDGNPFFVRQLVAAGAGAVGGGLSDVLLARVEALAGPTRQLLRAAAVIAAPASTGWLRSLSGLPAEDLDAALREALDARVLVVEPAAAPGEGRLAFRHSLVRDAVYHDLLPDERTKMHTGFAALLLDSADAQDQVADLAHHALAAQDLPLALSASVRASRAAARRGASRQALAHGEQALDLWPSVLGADTVAGASEVLVTRLAAMGAGDSGRPEQAVALLQRAVELADAQSDPVLAAATRVRHALRLLELPGREPDAAARAQDALDLLADRSADLDRAWGHAVLARSLHRLDRFDEAGGQAAAAVAVAREAGSDHARMAGADPYGAECDALGAEADGQLTLAFLGLPATGLQESRKVFADTKVSARLSGHFGVELRAYHGVGLCRLLEGDLRGAADEFAAGGKRATETGTTWSEYGMKLRVGRALVLFRLGGWDDADRVLGGDVPPGSDVIADPLAAARAVVAAARGRWDEVGLGPVRRSPAPASQVLLAQARAESALWQGRPRAAVAEVTAAVELARVTPAVQFDEAGRPDEELALAALGATAYAELAAAGRLRDEDAADSAALLARVRARVAGAAPNVPARAWLAWVEAEHRRLLGDADPGQWGEVAAAFGFGDPYRCALAHWRQAEALLGARSASSSRGANRSLRTEAAQHIATATELATSTGAAPLLAAIGDLAVRAGIRSADPVGAGNPLTARERSVLALVADGLTNRQIGFQLYISEKTASVHLSRIMSKLGTESRAEAVSVAHRRHLLG